MTPFITKCKNLWSRSVGLELTFLYRFLIRLCPHKQPNTNTLWPLSASCSDWISWSHCFCSSASSSCLLSSQIVATPCQCSAWARHSASWACRLASGGKWQTYSCVITFCILGLFLLCNATKHICVIVVWLWQISTLQTVTEVSLKDNNLHFNPKKQWMTAPALLLYMKKVSGNRNIYCQIFLMSHNLFLNIYDTNILLAGRTAIHTPCMQCVYLYMHCIY